MSVYSLKQRTVGEEISKDIFQIGFSNFTHVFVIFSGFALFSINNNSRKGLRGKIREEYFQLFYILHAMPIRRKDLSRG
jgi:hypothetical protein